jgi:hypothetical protein
VITFKSPVLHHWYIVGFVPLDKYKEYFATGAESYKLVDNPTQAREVGDTAQK